MNTFQVERADWYGEATLQVTSPDRSVHAVLTLFGATLIHWRIRQDGEDLKLTDGYRDSAELREQSGVRAGVMAPFPNRIADGRYRFAGREHDFLPGVTGNRTIYHGFARTRPFTPDTGTVAARDPAVPSAATGSARTRAPATCPWQGRDARWKDRNESG